MKTPPDLLVRWSKPEGSLLYVYQNNASKSLGSILSRVFEHATMFDISGMRGNEVWERFRRAQPRDPEDEMTVAKMMEHRGYDLKTFRFSIRKTPP